MLSSDGKRNKQVSQSVSQQGSPMTGGSFISSKPAPLKANAKAATVQLAFLSRLRVLRQKQMLFMSGFSDLDFRH